MAVVNTGWPVLEAHLLGVYIDVGLLKDLWRSASIDCMMMEKISKIGIIDRKGES